MEKLLLEIPTIYRKEDAVDFIDEFKAYNSNINGDACLNKYTQNYGSWLIKLVSDCDEKEGSVPAKTYFLVREQDNKIVGIVTVKLKSNEKTKENDGNIGYSIRPTEREKGYSKIILYLTLKECKNDKMQELLISNYRKNIASSKAIIALGGKLLKEKFIEAENDYLDFYTINIDESLEKYKNIYEKADI